MTGALTEIVLPGFEAVYKCLDKHDQQFAEICDEMSEIKTDIHVVKRDIVNVKSEMLSGFSVVHARFDSELGE